jgi:hypothetical protein
LGDKFLHTHFYLRYIYGGKLPLEEFDISDIFKILVTASELSLQELNNYLQSFLIKNNVNWIEQNLTWYIKRVLKMILSRNFKNIVII